MDKSYVSFDIETSGKTPGKYSMLSLGACLVSNPSVTFYREIKPITNNFNAAGVRVSAPGFRCLDGLRHIDCFNHESESFDASKVLEVLARKGDSPSKVMSEYADWVLEVTRGYKPIEAAAPIKFDGMFTAYYFENFNSEVNPFGHSGEDINSMYRGAVNNVDAHIAEFGLRKSGLPHNALEDAQIQAREFQKVLEIMAKK